MKVDNSKVKSCNTGEREGRSGIKAWVLSSQTRDLRQVAAAESSFLAETGAVLWAVLAGTWHPRF